MTPKRAAVALLEDEAVGPAADLAPLHRRFNSGGDRERVVLDFLEDDLREARAALGAVTSYVGAIEVALAGAGREELLRLALGGGPIERIEYLSELLATVRKRMAQVAARL